MPSGTQGVNYFQGRGKLSVTETRGAARVKRNSERGAMEDELKTFAFQFHPPSLRVQSFSERLDDAAEEQEEYERSDDESIADEDSGRVRTQVTQ